MKIKCPGCATVLQVPDTAAGKTVKCKCGKQFRVPGGAAAAGATAQKPAPQKPAQRPSPQTPQQPAAPAPAAQPFNPFTTEASTSGGILDELTDSDFSGVKQVSVPGRSSGPAPVNANTSKLLDEAMSNSSKQPKGVASHASAPRPGFLTFLGVINAFGALVFIALILITLGVLDMVAAAEGMADEDAVGTLRIIAIVGLGSLAAMSLATAVACFVRGKLSWYIVLVSYGWAAANHIFTLIDAVTADEIDPTIARTIGRLVFGFGIWAFLHGSSVRSFYGTNEEPVWRVVTFDVLGFAIGAGFGIAALVLA